jgi:hypothetical protein
MTMQASANVNVNPTLPGGSGGVPGVPPLPPMGNVTGQLAQGQQLLSKLQTGDVSTLLSYGITLASSAIPGQAGSLVRDMVTIGTATASGAAVGGPFGAVAGAVIGAIKSILSSVFGGSQPYSGLVICSTAASQALYAFVQNWDSMAGNVGGASSTPIGTTLLEYYLFKSPPSSTLRPNLLWYLISNANDSQEQASGWQCQTRDWSTWPFPIAEGQSYVASWPPTAEDQSYAQQYIALVAPIDTVVIWQWGQPSTEAVSGPGEYSSGWDQSESNVATIQVVEDDTKAIPAAHGKPGMTVSQIIASALARCPDPLFFATELYVNELSAGPTGGPATQIQNTATLSALATVLGMLAVGASTRAIVSELMVQQKQIELLDQPFIGAGETETVPDGHGGWKTVSAQAQQNAHPDRVIPPLFRQLVEDYVALAHAEASNPHATMHGVIMANRPHEPGAASTPAPTSGPSAKAQAAATISFFIKKYLHR